jgi:hypothetical protein
MGNNKVGMVDAPGVGGIFSAGTNESENTDNFIKRLSDF